MENLVNQEKYKNPFTEGESSFHDLVKYKNRNVLITGHTGFKGSWLSYILTRYGANVIGYSIEPPTHPNLFEIAKLDTLVDSVIGDIRDKDKLECVIKQSNPEIVLHLAAQPLVIESYKDPRGTYETNVMGTVNLLDACRKAENLQSILNVTTDKVYLNRELSGYGYVEDDFLDGNDPYSNSKSCSELVTHSYAKSFFCELGIPVSTARAGNVIGGGDFADNRIVPDCVRAVEANESLVVRNPSSTRPYQHVLEPLFAYLMIAIRQVDNPSLASSYNVGPDDCDCVSTGDLVRLFADAWGGGFNWVHASEDKNAPHEANFLKLDSSKLKETFGWKPKWHISDAIKATVEWTRIYLANENPCTIMDKQITDYLS